MTAPTRSFVLELPIRVALLEVEGIVVTRRRDAAAPLEACSERHREAAARAGVSSAGAIEGVRQARDLFRLLRIDPTKHRPSSEKLLNRVLKDKPLPSINTLVDVGNWCSLAFLLPLGLYDRDRLRGRIVLREGVEGESYRAIGDREINLAGRFLLADDEGPFGSPITDSRRTAVTEDTTATFAVIYAPLEYDAERLQGHVDLMGRRVVEFCGGEVVFCGLVAGSQ